jgi:hypothetical protein
VPFTLKRFQLQISHFSGGAVVRFQAGESGLPDFAWRNIPKRGKIYQITKNLPDGNNIYQMAVKETKCQKIYQHLSSTARPLIIYPNLGLWFENIPYGKPDELA